MGLLWFILAFAVLVIWIITILDVFKRHYPTWTTVGWIALVIVLPFIGSLIYWATRKESAEDVESYVAADAALRAENRSQSVDSTRTRL